MKHIATIFRRLFLAEPEKKVLGRWNIEHCDKMLNNKIIYKIIKIIKNNLINKTKIKFLINNFRMKMIKNKIRKMLIIIN